MSRTFFYLGLLLALVASPAAWAGFVVYVDAAATELPADGSTWCRAYRSLSVALAGAAPGTSVRVAGGTYSPDTAGLADPRSAHFLLPIGVAVVGGFAGCQAPDPNHRDMAAHETILTGDLAGDDDPAAGGGTGGTCCARRTTAGCDDFACQAAVCAVDPSCCSSQWFESCAAKAAGLCCDLCGENLTRCENAYHVVRTQSGADRSTVLDGVTIIGGYALSEAVADSSGGGLVIRSGSPTVRDCRIVANVAEYGAGLSIRGGNPLLIRCILSNNLAYSGGSAQSTWLVGSGMLALPEFVDCTFAGNRGNGLDLNSSNAQLTRCRFEANTGSGLAVNSGEVQARDCLFQGNLVSGLRALSRGTYSNCRFLGNVASGILNRGGGAQVNSPGVTFTNCLFSGNQAAVGGGAFVDFRSTDAAFRNCTFSGNSATTHSGGLRVDQGEITLDNCVLWGNTGPSGVALHLAQATATVRYSNLEGGLAGVTQTAGATLNWEEGNTQVDPLFVDADGPDSISGTEDDNLRLHADSPLVNAGNPQTLLALGETDLDGHARSLCFRVDMGAYEFGLGDFNCNRSVGIADFEAWPMCMGGPDSAGYPPGCAAFDAEFDNDVDLRDAASFFPIFEGLE